MIDLINLEKALKRRVNKYGYSWGRKQSDMWDWQTNFIYSTRTLTEVEQKISRFKEPLANYALNRWLNFWSAKGVEQIFQESPRVVANQNELGKWDFAIDGLQFDHKTSVWPRGYNGDANSKDQMIKWMYANQSSETREGHNSRLFVVLIDKDGEHWKLKAEISLIKTYVDNYMSTYDATKLVKYQDSFADIIYVVN